MKMGYGGTGSDKDGIFEDGPGIGNPSVLIVNK